MRKAFRWCQFSKSFYKREPSAKMIPFSSERGQQVFFKCVEEGNLRMFFRVCEQTVTQRDPNSCAASSVVSVLNTLEVDPQVQWKGIWRWYDEKILKHCPDKESFCLLEIADILRNNHVSLKTFLPLHPMNAKLRPTLTGCIYDATRESLFFEHSQCEAHAHVTDLHAKTIAKIRSTGPALYDSFSFDHAGCRLAGQRMTLSQISLPTFRSLLAFMTRQESLFMLVNYSRPALGQTGLGHFSPVGAFCRAHDLVLMHDVARFKYSYHWVSVADLFASLCHEDHDTHVSRGFVIAANQFGYAAGRLQSFKFRATLAAQFRGQASSLPPAGDEPALLLSVIDLPVFKDFVWQYLLEREISKDENAEALRLHQQLADELAAVSPDTQRLLAALFARAEDIDRLSREVCPAEGERLRLLFAAVASRLAAELGRKPKALEAELLARPKLAEEVDFVFSSYFR